jgi:hypothetical protein
MAINLDASRRHRRLGRECVIETWENATGFVVLQTITKGWTFEEVTGEAEASVAEYQFRFTYREGLDDWIKAGRFLRVGNLRLEIRDFDPAVGSPCLMRVRAIPVSGKQSVEPVKEYAKR